jgi:acetylornithine deacetylase/succinyl-diaminopimelate desuccinylase-like protein
MVSVARLVMAGSVKTNRALIAAQVLVVIVLVLGLFSPSPERDARPSPPGTDLTAAFERISPDSLLHTVRFLANQKTRRYSSKGSEAAVVFITNRLEGLGIPVERHDVTVADRIVAGTVHVVPGEQPPAAHERRREVVTNVLGDLSLSAPGGNSLIICAHYDSRGDAGTEIAPGADDNASGVAVLLEAARVLVASGLRPRVTLAFFGGEEDSLIGSSAFANEALEDHLPLRGAINVDMVGYDEYGPRDIVVFSNSRSIPLAVEVIENARRTTDLIADTTIVETGNSDHASFWRAGQTAISIWEGYDHNPHHLTTKDTPAVLTRDFLVEITKLVVSTAVHLGGVEPRSNPLPQK